MDLTRVSITGLQVVQQASALGSFSAAAEALGYTQSAVSRQIAAIEAAVGAPLFERVARGVRPTEAGTVLVEHATAVLAALRAAETAIARIRERLEGRLLLGSIPAAMSVLVPRAIARMSRQSPGLEIALIEGSTPMLVDQVRQGLVDTAVIALGPELPRYDLEGLRHDVLLLDALRVAVPAGHRLAGRERVPVRELRDEPWIVGEAAGENEPFFGAWPTLPDAAVAYVSREWPGRLGMVAAGLGIALLPGIAAASVPSGVVVVEIDDPGHRRRSAVALSPAEPSAIAREAVAALRAEAAGIALSGDVRTRSADSAEP
jgi:DNA-binding transcriptional LysR family regulator